MSDRPARPRHRDPDIIAAAVDEILPDVMGWLSEGRHDADEVRQQLIRCAEDDAYRFASNLDSRCYWFPDADLVEILGSFSTYSARETAVKEWVSTHAVTVPYAVGDTVSLRGQPARVVDIRMETAEIVAQPVVPDGKNYGSTGGWVHAVEDAQTCEVHA